MDKAGIEKLLSQYEKRAKTDFENYQASGIKHYLYSYHRNESLVDALRIALGAAAEHQAYIFMKLNISNFAQRAQQILTQADTDKALAPTQSLLEDIVTYGILEGLLRKE